MALFRYLIRLAFVLLLVPGAALASVTNGTIKGTTVDELGLPIPGVVVSIDSEALMGGKKKWPPMERVDSSSSSCLPAPIR
jgi:hypothetical protein